MNHQPIEDHMMLFSQLYPDALTQITRQQGVKKPRRSRSKKNKRGENGAVGAIKKRKLTLEQANILEQNFGSEHKLESKRKDRLALELGLDPQQVAVWFQNKRSRWKNKKLEEEYSNLKNAHETTTLEKCHLETEVLKLEEQLLEAKKEIQRLLDCANRAPSNSFSSSQTQSKEAVNPPFLGEFRVEEYDDGDMFYIPEIPYINGMEWINYMSM
ncbi:homeobox-leucine zipper protein ATHB-40-like [Gastrolobium bilobum]|uniref:homeobox-leucine zipper protein ATHB-40-like n=1 Tax=Gastrolobium bilobum TaxID=150636 RepID=UPI002AB29B80|nr:homeobox-leucine zipper protein ATHB-40-like [Gastrolobium bilobum]